MLSDPCQQTAIVSRQIRGALEGAIGPMVGVLQDCAVFEPCPCIFRSDGKQRFDCLFGILEPEELELDSRKNQAQFCASWATLHGRRSNVSASVYRRFSSKNSASARGAVRHGSAATASRSRFSASTRSPGAATLAGAVCASRYRASCRRQ